MFLINQIWDRDFFIEHHVFFLSYFDSTLFGVCVDVDVVKFFVILCNWHSGPNLRSRVL
jgi:hypothetical protein